MSNEMDSFVEKQTSRLCELWDACDGLQVPTLDIVSHNEQLANEAVLTDLLCWIEGQMHSTCQDHKWRSSFSDQLLSRVKAAGKKILLFSDEQLECMENLGAARVAEDFFRQARDFDPFLPFESIFQASRNVWTCNYLQALLDKPVTLTPSIFAYSMLYPVSDNFLDDPQRQDREKIEFNNRFSAWLAGKEAVPSCWDEEDVRDLVKMIEIQFSRRKSPQVYESLLAIHKAQIKSLKMAKAANNRTEKEVAAMTFEKGGTSVLADGFLAAGDLSSEEMEVIFNYGAFAQLMDDQEDILDDLAGGTCTLFTRSAKEKQTARLMDRVFQFSHIVLKGLERFTDPKTLVLKQMSLRGIDFLLIDAIRRTERCYSRHYLGSIQAHYPFRFEFMKRMNKEIRRKGFSVEHLLEMILPRRRSGAIQATGYWLQPMVKRIGNSA